MILLPSFIGIEIQELWQWAILSPWCLGVGKNPGPNMVNEGIDVFKTELKYGLDDKTQEADPPSKGARTGAKPDQSKKSLLEIAQE